MKIIISSDHGGFELKNKIAQELRNLSYHVEDHGPKEYKGDDDYPDYVAPLVENVSKDKSSLGILICRNGVGVSMLANKYPGIRAALSFDPKHAASARKDDNANVLALGADYTLEENVMAIVKAFIETPFGEAERHKRRLEKVRAVEKKQGPTWLDLKKT